ncbi:MAG: YceI family protein [Ilumatobacteraceae bacterium]|nr:YceI family protein [Ilumatobacteraceae bacterium]
MTDTSTSALPLAPGRWALDTNHSSVGFTIRHLGVSKVRGRFMRFEVDLDIATSVEASSLDATIELSSIDTGNRDRDVHVMSSDLLDVGRRPTIEFHSTRITGSADRWQVVGDVTIGGVTRPLTLAVDFGGVETFPGGGPRHAGFEATGELSRKDFGIDIAMPPGVSSVMLGDVVKFELDVQLLEPSD